MEGEDSASAPKQQMRVACFETEPWQAEYLKARLSGLDVNCFAEVLSEHTADLAKDADVVSVFIRSVVNRQAVNRLSNLKLVATRSTGYDHIDLAACEARGITVTNVPRYGENTVAEHTFGLMLALSRHIHQAVLRTMRGDFSLKGLEGGDLMGKTLGVVGAGAIGMHVVRIAKGFGMEVLAYDVRQQRLLAEVLGFQYASLEELLARSDVVTLHVPLLPQTYHLMNRERFKLMKRGALLINTARGGVVDTDALLWALDEGIVGGAGLDVIEGEELAQEEEALLAMPSVEEKLRMVVRQHVLQRRENVVLTPHMAFYSREAERRILDTTIANIKGFAEGKPEDVVAGPGPKVRIAA